MLQGGGACNTHCRWMTDDVDYDSRIDNAMRFARYVQIKSIYKLNVNKDCPPRGEPGYDPCAKYDFLYRVLVDNMNSITESASIEQCVDETSWLHMGFGTEVLHRLVGKPGVNKGGQTVMSFDAGLGRRYPRAYRHRRSLQPRDLPLTTEGEMEIKSMMDQLQPMCFGEGRTRNTDAKVIFKKKPIFIADNYFSGDNICAEVGRRGFGALFTCRRDQLPKDIPIQYLHHSKGNTNTKRGVHARYDPPVIFVKRCPKKGNDCAYTRVHLSM